MCDCYSWTLSGRNCVLLWNMYWFVPNFSFILESSQIWYSFSYNGSKKTTSTPWFIGIVEVGVSLVRNLLGAPHFQNLTFGCSSEQDANILESCGFASVAELNIDQMYSKCLAPECLTSGSLARCWRLWGVVVVFVTFWQQTCNVLLFAHRNKIPKSNISPKFCVRHTAGLRTLKIVFRTRTQLERHVMFRIYK